MPLGLDHQFHTDCQKPGFDSLDYILLGDGDMDLLGVVAHLSTLKMLPHLNPKLLVTASQIASLFVLEYIL